jgi:hypothetical protein
MSTFIDANLIWLIRSNIARFEQILNGELTAVQRGAIEQLLAQERAKLEGLAQSERGHPAAGL